MRLKHKRHRTQAMLSNKRMPCLAIRCVACVGPCRAHVWVAASSWFAETRGAFWCHRVLFSNDLHYGDSSVCYFRLVKSLNSFGLNNGTSSITVIIFCTSQVILPRCTSGQVATENVLNRFLKITFETNNAFGFICSWSRARSTNNRLDAKFRVNWKIGRRVQGKICSFRRDGLTNLFLFFVFLVKNQSTVLLAYRLS